RWFGRFEVGAEVEGYSGNPPGFDAWRFVDRVSGRPYLAPRFSRDAARPQMSEREPPDPLAQLGERINRARSERIRREPAVGDRSALQQGISFGLRIGIELVVAIGVATGLGWAIDHWLGTRPWGIIVLFFLGVAAGMLNVYRAVSGISTPVGFRRPDTDNSGARARPDAWDDDEN